MNMKPTDLEKNKGTKINGRMGAAGIPSRFGAGSATLVDKREQREKERAQGLVPFACKLPSTLVKQLQERAAAHPEGLNVMVAELLGQAMGATMGAK